MRKTKIGRFCCSEVLRWWRRSWRELKKASAVSSRLKASSPLPWVNPFLGLLLWMRKWRSKFQWQIWGGCMTTVSLRSGLFRSTRMKSKCFSTPSTFSGFYLCSQFMMRRRSWSFIRFVCSMEELNKSRAKCRRARTCWMQNMPGRRTKRSWKRRNRNWRSTGPIWQRKSMKNWRPCSRKRSSK